MAARFALCLAALLACALPKGEAVAQSAAAQATAAPPAAPAPPPVPQASLVAELSQSRVEITTGFSGTEILVFGSTDRTLGIGHDEILILAEGPPQPLVVRRKINVLGLWINGPSARFNAVPSFYAVAGTRPAALMLPAPQRQAAHIGLENLPLRTTQAVDPEFRQALVDLKTAADLWSDEETPVEITGNRLFHARVPVPATVAPGDYHIAVLLVREGRIVARQEIPLRVERAGTAARINDLAHDQGAIYGLVCVIAAALAGWLGSIVFRRG
ncbi:TIGR02186 family protein [Acetobacteraceae bacterium H6797]|nr:TIGR02186 family protein [Acetobacteraceae bacterium H6797]